MVFICKFVTVIWLSHKAVSYTHLDVYKRQLLAWLRRQNKTEVVVGSKGLSPYILWLLDLQ